MADSINRIVPPSVSFDRTAQPGRDGQKKSRAEKRKQNPGEANAPAPDGQREEPAKEPAESEQDKGKHLDISA